MGGTIMRFPFRATFNEIKANIDPYINSVFSCLESDFLTMPKGKGFIEYPVFEQGYEALKGATKNFTQISIQAIFQVASVKPISIIVLRSMLGFTPSEWAYMTTQHSGEVVSQNFARTIDREIRFNPLIPIKLSGKKTARIEAMIEVACRLLLEGPKNVNSERIHRLDKADTREGIHGIQALAGMGVPYAMLLYERFLGRPFAGHRDSVSELVGDPLEFAIEQVLDNSGISSRKTKRAQRIEGFDQTPDFIIPSEFNPQIIIEAKITEDDGTARDKATRIQHLGELSMEGQPPDQPKFEVIACIGGRGFAVRRADMKKILIATRGKVFTLKTLDSLVEFTTLKKFRTK